MEHTAEQNLEEELNGPLLDELQNVSVPIDRLIEGLLTYETAAAHFPGKRKKNAELSRVLQAACRAAKETGMISCCNSEDLHLILSRIPESIRFDANSLRQILEVIMMEEKAQCFVQDMPQDTFVKLNGWAQEIIAHDEDDPEDPEEEEFVDDLIDTVKTHLDENGAQFETPSERNTMAASIIESYARSALSKIFYS